MASASNKISQRDAVKIHQAIHSGASSVLVAGHTLPITQSKGGLRETAIYNVRIIEQNPKKNSAPGAKARAVRRTPPLCQTDW